MRLIVCLIPLLFGCGAPAVRCDTQLQPINPPAARDITRETHRTPPVRRTP